MPNDLKGTKGVATFYCTRNFKLPVPTNMNFNEMIHEPDILQTEPCGIHQADLWCILNGQVCPYLMMGLKPLDNEIQEIRQALRGEKE